MVPLNVTGRNDPALSHTIGYFAHILHLTVECPAGLPFRDLIHQVSAEYSAASERSDFGYVVTQCPQFIKQLWVQWNPPFRDESHPSGWAKDLSVGDPSIVGTRNPQVNAEWASNLILEFAESHSEVYLTCWYRTDLFQSDTVRALTSLFMSLCRTFCENPLNPI